MVQYTLTPDFTQTVDNLIRDVTVPDTILYSRAQQYLNIFNETNDARHSPTWAERIHKAAPHRPPFTTPRLFNTLYQVADELGLVAGRRYVSAAICVCAEHAARADAPPVPDERAALMRALHELSSTWAAFLLWPLYALGRDEDRILERDDLSEASGDATPTAESMARAQRRRCRDLVMARDNYRCFLSGGLDRSAYFDDMPLPAGVTGTVRCCTVSIIPPEVLAQPDTSQDRNAQPDLNQHPALDQDIMPGTLTGFFSVDTITLAEHAHGPANTLVMHGWAADAFTMFLWWLLPSETNPNRYEVRISDPAYDISLCHPPPRHVTFVDHSHSDHGVELPSRELLRAHTALALVLHRSGAKDAFGILQNVVPARCRGRGVSGRSSSSESESEREGLCPGATGGAFWRSVVEYEGPEVCLEVGLWEAAQVHEVLDSDRGGTRT